MQKSFWHPVYFLWEPQHLYMTVGVDFVADKSMYGKHGKKHHPQAKSANPEKDKDTAPLILAVYSLKTVDKKKKSSAAILFCSK